MLPWSWAVERLEAAIVYWLATTGADGAPHLIPIWGAWVDGRWYVEGGPTRWQRNLRENPQLAIQVEIGDEVVIVEGTASEHRRPAEAAGRRRSWPATRSTRPRRTTRRAPTNWTEGGLWELRPVKAFAWSVFPDDMTRFRFDTERGDRPRTAGRGRPGRRRPG